jgi:hypothetical protein
MITTAEQWLIDISASWWVMVPSVSLYPDAHNTDPKAAPIAAIQNLHALILPITAMVAMGGMLWNGLLMVLSRKPAPLVNVLRGLWNTALWSAVGVFATNLLLAATDAFSGYVITSALHTVGDPSLAKRMATLLVPVTGHPGGLPVGMVIVVGGIAMICALIQALLMLFRDGAVLILAGLMPLAASGSFTTATNGWTRKLLSWQLSLVFYKAFAAMVYACAIWLTGENTAKDPRILLIGVAMMLVALVALPVLLRFFNWTVGGLHNSGGGLGMLATAGAAGMHAAASLRGGGSGVNEHARYLSEMFDRGKPPGGPGRGPAPSGRGRPGPGPMPGGPPARPPAFTRPAPSPAGSAVPATSGTGVALGSASTASGASSAAMGASAAAGPAAPVVAAAVAVTSTVAQTAKAAAHAAADATGDSTKGG